MEHFRKVKEDIESPGNWVRVDILGALHDFNLETEKDNFYFILETTSGEEKHVTEA